MASVKTIGKSAEKRPIQLLTLGKGNSGAHLYIQSTLHGREWITPIAPLFAAYTLLSQPSWESFLNDVKISMIPFINPDGFEYSHTPASKSEQARLWRKNRRLLPCKGEKCVHGIDLNRNWGIAGKTFGFGATR